MYAVVGENAEGVLGVGAVVRVELDEARDAAAGAQVIADEPSPPGFPSAYGSAVPNHLPNASTPVPAPNAA
ncbi:hypothetical protein [Streptomyces sp. NPDC058964]|uniref:hypothetical protein n=1 Tax=Streptomyces sp. NPDC058964 TaxID=3346681 RepID=UPI003689C95A